MSGGPLQLGVLGQSVSGVPGTDGVDALKEAGDLLESPGDASGLDFLQVLQTLDSVRGALVDLVGLDEASREGEPVQGAVAAVGAVLVGKRGAEEPTAA